MTVQDRVSGAFGTLGRWSHRNAWWVLLSILLSSGALVSQLPKLQVDTSFEGFLRPDAPLRVQYQEFRERFGSDQKVVLAIESPVIFSRDFLRRLRDLHRALEQEVPHVDTVKSLINARETRGDEDSLIVGELFDHWPETDAELASIAERARSNPLYRDFFLSRDGNVTALVVELDAYSRSGTEQTNSGFDATEVPATAARGNFLSGDEAAEVANSIERIRAAHSQNGFTIHTTGMPILTTFLQTAISADVQHSMSYAIVTILVVLWIIFRRVAGVLLPSLLVILSVLSTMGLMAVIGDPMSLPTQSLPTFLLVVCLGDSIFVLTLFFQQRRTLPEREAVSRALAHAGPPCLFTSLTTAGSLLGFAVADIAPLAKYALYGPLGVMLAFVYTVLLLPALIAILPIRPDRDPKTERFRPIGRLLAAIGDWAVGNRRSLFVITACLLVAAGVGARNLRFTHVPLDWLPEENSFRIATELLNQRLGGAMHLEAVIDSGSPEGLKDPEFLAKIDAFEERLGSLQVGDVRVGKVISLSDIVKEIHGALNGSHEGGDVIPNDRGLLAQELLLFENSGSDDLEDVTDSQFQLARVTMSVPFVDGVQYPPYLKAVQAEFEAIFGSDVDVSFTGLMVIISATIDAMNWNTIWSYAIAFFVVTVLMMLVLGSARLGLVSMIPNVLPILLTLGIVGWVRQPVDNTMIMIGVIAIGLAVDDTIHFIYAFQREYRATGDARVSVRATMETTGVAMLFTSIVLALGFFLYMIPAQIKSMTAFGLYTGIAITLAFFADLLVGPALVSYYAADLLPRTGKNADR